MCPPSAEDGAAVRGYGIRAARGFAYLARYWLRSRIHPTPDPPRNITNALILSDDAAASLQDLTEELCETKSLTPQQARTMLSILQESGVYGLSLAELSEDLDAEVSAYIAKINAAAADPDQVPLPHWQEAIQLAHKIMAETPFAYFAEVAIRLASQAPHNVPPDEAPGEFIAALHASHEVLRDIYQLCGDTDQAEQHHTLFIRYSAVLEAMNYTPAPPVVG